MIISLLNDHILFFARYDDTGRYRFCVYGWRRFGVDADFGLLQVLCSILSHPVVGRKYATKVKDQAIENSKITCSKSNDLRQ
jgi:hypothetical protein